MLNLKKIRLDKKTTQKQLSEISGVSQSYISEIENNGHICTVYILCRLCKALGVTPNELLDKSFWSNSLDENE